jgi:hypothetical protein
LLFILIGTVLVGAHDRLYVGLVNQYNIVVTGSWEAQRRANWP